MSDALPELPLLPDPTIMCDCGGKYYTAEQMRDYARQAVFLERERCAKLCEDLSAFDMYDPGSSVAAAIRAGTTQQEPSR